MPPVEVIALWAPVLPRLAVALVGALLCVDGARVYRLAVGLAAFGTGAVCAAALGRALEIDPLTVGLVALGAGLVATLLARVVEKLTLAVAGALVGGLLVGSVETTLLLELPWWAAPVGALLGAGMLPLLFRRVLTVITPVVGGVLLAWGVGMPGELWVIAVASVVGLAMQWKRRQSRRAEE